ncbi:MAG TPA: acVLRF1 family peptidyl-tRNA hydrolase [Streptosporangiaceae bacterium]|nr:acVLRF1 family peptidyl-tRNA hydrolase [Streptosporangiaceae bacterium]
MAAGRPAAGGGRWLEVGPDRLVRWLAGFADRHGGLSAVERGRRTVSFRGADGAVAECHVPFPPLLDQDAGPDPAAALAAHAAADRLVGVILVRLGGYAAGVFEGERLVASRVGSRPVHGRSSAGGWSQHRFARRRDKQAREALAAAATGAAGVLGPYARRLDAVVLGGDRRAVAAVRDDARLAPLFALAAEPFLSVPDPTAAVLKDAPRRFRAVRIRLTEAPERSPS